MIMDYLKWRGDLSFEKDKLNKIDALIFARLSYIYFDNIVDENEILLKDALISFKGNSENLKKTMLNADFEFVDEILKSKRFQKVKISNYIDKVSKESEKQFSAVTFYLPTDIVVIAFRGTDLTVTGWKEDFNLSFLKHIPSQKESVKYLEKIMDKYTDKKIIITGHSKGGNLAVYSSIFLKEEYKDRVEKVYNFDGPGFCDEILEDQRYDEILNRIKTYIPRESLVGLILNRKEKVKVIKSNQKSIMQHDLYTWVVLQKDFVYENSLSKSSQLVAKSIMNWLEEVKEDDREKYINIIFDIISNIDGDMKNIVTDISLSGKILFRSIQDPNIQEMLRKFINIVIKELKDEYLNKNSL